MRKLIPLELLHTDICGLLPPTSQGEIYFATFTDDYKRLSFVYPMKVKSDIAVKFQTYKAHVENLTSKTIKAVRSDKAREFEMGDFGQILRTCCIYHELKAP